MPLDFRVIPDITSPLTFFIFLLVFLRSHVIENLRLGRRCLHCPAGIWITVARGGMTKVCELELPATMG
jgi:hypothetical protein